MNEKDCYGNWRIIFISDNRRNADIHLNIGDGELDVKQFKRFVDNGMAALETAVNVEKQINDIRMVRNL